MWYYSPSFFSFLLLSSPVHFALSTLSLSLSFFVFIVASAQCRRVYSFVRYIMFRRSVLRYAGGAAFQSAFPVHRDTDKQPRITVETGVWLYHKETSEAFQQWCRERQVRAYGNIRITTTPQFARCLRVAKPLEPGQAIITCPASACYNMLTVAKEQTDCPASGFPLQLNWMNYNERLPYLKSTCVYEVAMAGWLARVVSLEESPFTPYIKFLLEDTRGKDGISNGISREREDAGGMLDVVLSEMATDACEEPEVFLENFFRGLAAVFLRSQPIEPEVIEYYIPGTNFFKAKAREMFVPTLIPLLDCVPQMEDGSHNAMVQFFPYKGDDVLREQCRELQIPFFERGGTPLELTYEETAQGLMQKSNMDQELMDPALLRGAGFFALRAMQPLEVGDVLFVRRFPREGMNVEDAVKANMTEAARLMSHHN